MRNEKLYPSAAILQRCFGAVSVFLLVLTLPLTEVTQGAEEAFLDPNDVLAVWDFQESAGGDHAMDLLAQTRLEFVGDAKFSADGQGRSGEVGDIALDFGTAGSVENPTHARVTGDSASGVTFLELLNNSNATDTLSVAFWQRWNSGQVANSSSVWFTSPSAGAGSGDRGFQAHLPWGNGIVYFDTVGCCDVPGSRLNGGVQNVAPPLNWGEWHHVVLVKNKGAKEVWVNGQLALGQASGAVALATDWLGMYLGQSPTEPGIAFHGWMDDVAVFGAALNETQIVALAEGASPLDLTLPADQWPPRITGVFPADGAEFYSVTGGIGFQVTTADPNQIATDDVTLLLNGTDVSSQLVFEGSPNAWVARYTNPLALNQNYSATIGATDSEGRKSSLSWSFNTLEGDPTPEFGAVQLSDIAVVTNEGGIETQPAMRAIDGIFSTYSETADTPGAHWLMTLDRLRPVQRVELINRADGFADRMDGLELEILDEDSNVVASAEVISPGAGGVWSFEPPAGTLAKQIRIGLPEGQRNGAGDFVVSLAEVILFTARNYAQDAESYMMRYSDSLPPTAYGNDGDYSTHTETTPRAVGSFFEVDLGEERALYQIRVVAADGFQSRMTHTTVRVFDDNHDSIYSEHLGGSSPIFDVYTPGPVFARYVRVGFENKERSESGTFWYLGLKELQAFGRPLDEVGLIEFEAIQTEISSGETVQLSWLQDELRDLKLYPVGEAVLPLTGPNGVGLIEVAPEETTEYTLVGSLFSETLVRHITVEVDGQPLPPRINEFLADNRLTLEDGYGDASDWIEIRNPNNNPLELGGYGLSDDPAQPMKWVFPSDVVLGAHESLIVFASGRADPYDNEGGLHANFALQDGGESLALIAPDGVTVLDLVESYPPQSKDLAYGRTLSGEWAFMEPTPDNDNTSASYEGWLEPVIFSHGRGFYDAPFTLTLEHPNADVELWVSTDGGATESLYTQSIQIDGNTSVRVQARLAGSKSPRIQTHSYLFIEDTLQASNMDSGIINNPAYSERARQGLIDLPTVSVSIPELPDDWDERPASVELFLPGEEPIQANAGMERFGGAWTNFAKKNYRLKFRREYGAPKLEAPLFAGFDRGILAVDQFDEIDLRGGGHDMNSRGFYMSSRISEDTMLEMGSLNPHGRFVHLYLNGEYWGQYHARERLTDAFLADYLGGKTEDYTNVRGNDNDGSGFVSGTPDPVNRDPWLTMRSLRNDYEEVRDLLDVPHLIDFMLMWNFGDAESEYRSAGPILPGSGFKFWLGDADGHIRTGSDRTNNAGPGDLFGALVNQGHPDFMTLLADRAHMHLFNGGAMTPERNIVRLERRMKEIENSLVVEAARWGYRDPVSWENAAQNALDNIYPSQTQTMISRLRGRGLYPSLDAPELSQHGGAIDGETTLDVQVGSGTVYYTLDGTDPRLPGGMMSPDALELGSGGGSQLTGPNGEWSYLDIGQAPDGDWTAVDADTSSWKSGSAPLGYGDPGMGTTLNFGEQSNNKFSAYYFRREFDISDPSLLDRLTLQVVRDDGVVVYLNGVEVARDNLPSGELTYETLALSAAGGGDETMARSFEISSALLRPGRNVLAAEVHQASRSSSDLRFDAWLQSAVSLEVTLSPGTVFKGRAFDGTNWSALTEARFFGEVALPPTYGDLIISELSYNPDGSDEFEFLEIMSASGHVLDLSGLRLSGGIDFLFPDGLRLEAGKFIVITESLEAFQQRYQDPTSEYYFADIQAIGNWAGRLNDAGEQIDLLGASGIPLISVIYDNANGWPATANGDGSSLELLDPIGTSASAGQATLMLDQPELWRASRLYHGSPGRLDEGSETIILNIVRTGSPGGLVVSFEVEAGQIYHVEKSDSLENAIWTVEQTLEPVVSGVVEMNLNLSLDLNTDSSYQFYRVRAGAL